MERLISGAYSTAGLWPTWLRMLPGLILDLPQTPHDCLSPVEKCFHHVHLYTKCLSTQRPEDVKADGGQPPLLEMFSQIFIREEV